MRIVFFNPDFPKPGEGDIWLPCSKEDYIHPPLGLLALATSCVRAGHESYVYDLTVCNNPKGKFEMALKEFQPDVVAFTAFTSNEVNALNYAKRCGELNLPVVIGGHAATFNWENILRSPGVSAVVCGEGEHPLITLLDSWESEKHPEDVPGLHLRGENGYTPAVRIASLDELPALDFDLIDITPYVRQEALGMVTSRGCPYNCFFCSSQKMWTRLVTYRSLDNVLSELDSIVSRYNYEGKLFTFFDDTFTFDRNRILAFCDALRKRPYTVFWKAMTRVDRVDAELLRTMYEANCRHVVFGIEAVTDEDLRRLNKGFSIDQAKRAVDYANRAGLITESYFMIGYPWQAREDFFSSVNAIHDFHAKTPRLSCLTPYPGTHFGENLKTYGMRIPLEDHSRFNNLLPVVETDNFTLHDQAEAMLAFIESYVLPNMEENLESPAEESIIDLFAEEASEETTFSEISKDNLIEALVKAGRTPRSSPFIAFRQLENEVLAFEYRSGGFALLNQSAAAILKYCQKTTKLDELLVIIHKEFGNVDRDDLIEVLRLLGDLGFLIEE